MSLVGRVLMRLRAIGHTVCGWVCYRAGLRLRARRHYERVLQLRGDDFHAFMQLGRIAFSVGDYTRWRREFDQARRIDPRAFAKQSHPFEELGLRLAGTPHAGNPYGKDEAGAGWFGPANGRATWRTPGGGERAGKPRESGEGEVRRDDSVRRGAEPEAELEEDALYAGDDCTSSRERRRFRELGPIRAPEVGACDLEELAKRLSGS
jgi:hypothetical protein